MTLYSSSILQNLFFQPVLLIDLIAVDLAFLAVSSYFRNYFRQLWTGQGRKMHVLYSFPDGLHPFPKLEEIFFCLGGATGQLRTILGIESALPHIFYGLQFSVYQEIVVLCSPILVCKWEMPQSLTDDLAPLLHLIRPLRSRELKWPTHVTYSSYDYEESMT